MEYAGQICRPPMERGSFMLPVAEGCVYNRCRFCTLFKHLTYHLLPLEDVEQRLRQVAAVGGSPRHVFLGDGSAFAMDTERLLAILDLLHTYFPTFESAAMDATVTDLARKSDEELLALARTGVRRLYVGVESGLADVLAFMEKDHTPDQARVQIQRLQAAGMGYGAHIMTGIAGAGRGVENGRATAAFLNETKPERVVNFSLFLHRSAPLYRQIEAGTFRPAPELENLEEALVLVRELEGCDFDGFHDFVPLRVRGRLPRDRARMTAALEKAIDEQREKPPVYALVP